MMPNKESDVFLRFKQSINSIDLPDRFSMMEDGVPHPLCVLAAEELQEYIEQQTQWQHNFGLNNLNTGMVIGKMFGVLIVAKAAKEIGYLAAFSGKLAGGNYHAKFVPPVFDTLATDGFLNKGMLTLSALSDEIRALALTNTAKKKVDMLKLERKQFSHNLQNEIFEHYHFLNKAGEEKSLVDLFAIAGYKNPPAGAGECAGPKLLQYAFQHQLKPLAIAEFWWGLSPKSEQWKHKQFYACCKEKCEPILAHMLKGI